MVKRPEAWRKRSLEDIKKRLREEETGFVIGKITGQIESPTAEQLSTTRKFLWKIIKRWERFGKKHGISRPTTKWHDSSILTKRIRRLRRKVRRIEKGTFRPSDRKGRDIPSQEAK